MEIGESKALKKQHMGSRDAIRERLKQQCVARVRQERGNILSRLRNVGGGVDESLVEGIARGLVQGELSGQGDSFMSCVEGLAASRPPVDEDGSDGLSQDEYIDLMKYLEDAVVEELRRQEQEILSYAQHLCDQESLEIDALTSTQHQVICPVCMKDGLHINKNVIFCACGMRVSTQTDQISLEQLEQIFLARYAAHGNVCGCKPVCSVQCCGGFDMLMLTCADCDFMEIVL